MDKKALANLEALAAGLDLAAKTLYPLILPPNMRGKPGPPFYRVMIDFYKMHGVEVSPLPRPWTGRLIDDLGDKAAGLVKALGNVLDAAGGETDTGTIEKTLGLPPVKKNRQDTPTHTITISPSSETLPLDSSDHDQHIRGIVAHLNDYQTACSRAAKTIRHIMAAPEAPAATVKTASTPKASSPGNLLRGWKEIAIYMRVCKNTARKREKMGWPIRREGKIITALRSEIDLYLLKHPKA